MFTFRQIPGDAFLSPLAGGLALVAAFICVSTAFSIPADAGPIYTVNVSPGLSGPLSDSAPVSASGVLDSPPGTFTLYGGPENYWSVEASARSESGLLATNAHAIANFSQSMTYAGVFGGPATAGATFTIDDLVFTGPGTTVSGNLRLLVDGAFGADAGSGVSNVTSTGSVQVDVSMRAPNFLAADSGYAQVVAHKDGSLPATTSGLLTDYTGGPKLIEVPFVDAPVGTPITLYLGLVSGGSASVNLDGAFFGATGWAEGYSNYADTLSFASSGNVFVLPTGYTANSSDGGIVDNRYGAPQPVPEPASWVLLATGLIIPGLRRELRQRRRNARRGTILTPPPRGVHT